MTHSFRPRFRTAIAALGLATCVSTTSAAAQSATREACTTGDLIACVQVTVTAEATAGGSSLVFNVSHLGAFGSLEVASRPSMVWSLAFSTGRDLYADPSDILELPTDPVATGSAVLSDADTWSFTDVGDLWALSYPSFLDADLTTKGIGSAIPFSGIATDAFGNPWRQIGTTGPGEAIAFGVLLPYAVDVSFDWFSIVGLEAVSFTPSLTAPAALGASGTCGFETPCGVVPTSAVPEPSSLLLLGVGVMVLGLYTQRRVPRTPEMP